MTTPSEEQKKGEGSNYKTHPELEKIIGSSTWYRTLIETMDDGIVASDLNKVIVYANPSACKKLGYTLEELLGLSALDIIVEEDHPRVIRESEIRFEEKVSSQYEVHVRTKLGSKLPVLISGSPILNEKNQMLGTYALITDIRDRKVVEKELRDKNNELQT